MKVLHMDCSVRIERSISRRLSAYCLAHLQAQSTSPMRVDRLDLLRNEPPFPTDFFVQAMYTPEEERSPAMVEELAFSDSLVDRLLANDLYIIGMPMYNFSVPSNFKAFIDNIVRVGRTFTKGEEGYKGMLSEKKAIVISVRGADYNAPEYQGLDYLVPYLKTVFGFMGLVDVEYINVQPVQFAGEEAKLAAIQKAKEQIEALQGSVLLN